MVPAVRIDPRRTPRWIGGLVGLAAMALLVGVVQQAPAAGATVRLRVSANENRTSASALSGASLSGPMYVFVGPRIYDESIDRVYFRLDGRLVPGAFNDASIDWYTPWDLMGGDTDVTKPFDFSTLSRGTHTISAQLVLTNSQKQTISSTFTVRAGTSGTPSASPTPTATPRAPTPTATPTATATSAPPATTAPPSPTTTPTSTASPSAGGRTYPLHTNIASTTFWVGELFDATLADGSQVCSTYDSLWAYHWSGVNGGKVPAGAAGCAGSIIGGCDGIAGSGNSCATEPRTAANGFFPTRVTPKENPFYLDLPYDDLNDSIGFAQRCSIIPWANDPGYAGHCTDGAFSYMKNRWVQLTGPNGSVCYGQVEDAGPSHGDLYHDANYVFGANNAQPVQGKFNNAGADVSPALNGCLGFKELDGQSDKISWRFVDRVAVPAGPWTRIETTSGVSE